MPSCVKKDGRGELLHLRIKKAGSTINGVRECPNDGTGRQERLERSEAGLYRRWKFAESSPNRLVQKGSLEEGPIGHVK